MAKVFVFDHPLIQHKLTYIRDKETGTKEFRELVDEVATLMAFEITRDMALEETEIETPVCIAKIKSINREENWSYSDPTCRNWNGGWRFKINSSCKSRTYWFIS